MRPISLVPLLCAIAAFILSMLCLFAGSKRDFLANADILTMNTSMIGDQGLFNTTDGDGGLLSTLENDFESEINNLVSGAIELLARKAGIHDFYALHVMNYCDGYYTPNATVVLTGGSVKENVTYCSGKQALFHFDPKEILENDTVAGFDFSQLKWPDAIEDDIKTMRKAFKAMFVFYVIGIAFTGLVILGSLVSLFTTGKLSALVDFISSILAFICLGIASAIATAFAVKAVDEINNYGKDVGVSATRGKTFLGMTWAASALMLVASLTTIFVCISAVRRRRVPGGRKVG